MSIPRGLKVTKLVNGMDYAPLSDSEAHLAEEEIDRLNTPYKGYGYAKDQSNNISDQPVIVLINQIKKEEIRLALLGVLLDERNMVSESCTSAGRLVRKDSDMAHFLTPAIHQETQVFLIHTKKRTETATTNRLFIPSRHFLSLVTY